MTERPHRFTLRDWVELFGVFVALVTLGPVVFTAVMTAVMLILFLYGDWSSHSAWILDGFLIAFALFALWIKLPCEYDDSLIVSKVRDDPEFRNSLEVVLTKSPTATQFRSGIIAFITRYDQGFVPEKPSATWQDVRTSRERLARAISDACMTACAIAFAFLIWAALGYGFYAEDLSHVISEALRLKSLVPFSEWLKLFAPFSLVSMLVWLNRRARADGVVQGYLHGYRDAFDNGRQQSR